MRKYKVLSVFFALAMTVFVVSPISNISQARNTNEQYLKSDSIQKTEQMLLDENIAEQTFESLDLSDLEDHLIENTLEDDDYPYTFTVGDTLNSEGDYGYISIVLGAGDIVQAKLVTPNISGLNYDLFLYNDNEGEPYEIVEFCTLAGVDDALSYINDTEEDMVLYVVAQATSGYSATTPFTMTISIDKPDNYDVREPNDSPFQATTASYDTVYSNVNLNVINDQDWYYLEVPSGVNGIEISMDESDYTVDVFEVTGYDSYVFTMSSVSGTDGVYLTSGSDYYIRVSYTGSGAFVPESYAISFAQYTQENYTITLMSMNTDTTNSSAIYNEGWKYRAKNRVTATVKVADEQGAAVPNKTVKMTWISGAWNPGTYNYTRNITAVTDSFGQATLNLQIPTAIGQHSYTESAAVTVTHYYDIDTLKFECGNYAGTLQIYHLAYSV